MKRDAINFTEEDLGEITNCLFLVDRGLQKKKDDNDSGNFYEIFEEFEFTEEERTGIKKFCGYVISEFKDKELLKELLI